MPLKPVNWISLAALSVVIAAIGCQPDDKNEHPPQPQANATATAKKPAPVAPAPAVGEFGLSPAVKSMKSDVSDEFEITYEWKVSKKREQDWRVFVHFTYPDGGIAFQNDHVPEPPTSQWEPGRVSQGPFTVKIPLGTEGTFDIRMGLFQTEGAEAGSSARDELDGQDDGEKRYLVGRLIIADGKAELKPAE